MKRRVGHDGSTALVNGSLSEKKSFNGLRLVSTNTSHFFDTNLSYAMTKLAVGDRVTLPDGTQGVVVNPEAQLEQAINASKEQAQLEADAARQEQRDLEDAIEQSQLTRDRAEALEREAPKTEAEEEEALSQAVDQSLQGERAFAEKLQRQYNDEAGYEKMMHIAEQDAVAAQFEVSPVVHPLPIVGLTSLVLLAGIDQSADGTAPRASSVGSCAIV